MGCGCGSAVRRKVKYKKLRTKSITSQIIPKNKLKRSYIRKTCPKCGWPMSGNVRKYDPVTKKAVMIWNCTNRKKCGHRMQR